MEERWNSEFIGKQRTKYAKIFNLANSLPLELGSSSPYKQLPPGNYPGNMDEIVQVGCWNMHLLSIEMMSGFS